MSEFLYKVSSLANLYEEKKEEEKFVYKQMSALKFCGLNFNQINKEGDEKVTEFHGKVNETKESLQKSINH